MLNKEVNEILIKFAEKCTSINSNIRYKDCLKIGRDIICNTGTEDIRLLIRTLNYKVVKIKREYYNYRPKEIKKRVTKHISIDEFISRNIASELLQEISYNF